MPPAEPAPRRRPGGELRLTIALWVALAVTMVPLLRVVHSGAWMAGAAILSAALLGAGFGLRRIGRMPAVAVTLIQFVVWVVAVTAVFLPGTAMLGVLPSAASFGEARDLVESAAAQIVDGVAPLEPSAGLSFVIVACLGLLAIGLDHVVLTTRMPLLATIALVAVWLIPAIAVPAGVDVPAFVLLAAAILWLLRAETRTREAAASPRAGGVTALALTVGALAITGAVVVGPALPPPTAAPGGLGAATSIDPTLDLGDDLRRPGDVTVLTLHGDAPDIPYLRVATLSSFDGRVWQPDRPRSVPLAADALAPVTAEDGVRVTEYRTSVQVSQLSSEYLPIPFPAVGVAGLEGAWSVVPYSRTVFTASGNVQGQSYDVVSHVPRPTLEQIRSSSARIADSPLDLTALPADTPGVIARTARSVTAGAVSDYDRLVALQSWFRGPEFTYSLSAPVQDGFDDAGVDAVAAFLDRKQGYCVHFAGSFALMARSLGMPSRVVVGFLPGSPTGRIVDGERVAAVTMSQLHAWPEVYFDGIGWVPFEPTKSLGVATEFRRASEPADSAGTDVATPSAAPSPTSSATGGPAERPDQPSEAAPAAARSIDVWPVLTAVFAALLVAIAPATATWVRRRMRRARGGIDGAWRNAQDAAIDRGIPLRLAETPRAFGQHLIAGGAPPDAVARLVSAVERASYAPEQAAGAEVGGRASVTDRAFTDAERIRRGLFEAVPTGDRVRTLVLPRSLVIRPGSGLAERGARA
ncbi:transglutaminase TgpA family protein [Microbacterium dextranolyticum]|uniref:Transglutaminase n=1 Tax=Microbacterium dextranolyticum TaxID=36806 RepID=A0A9W6HKZ9_9MICO|nr:DUF3488 and transglutaminase-like domain-containing protein [Microbacterium dextranolyticum]MBM7462305.1 transglutaminase-like putative cysteine protease [Microbacterium dextranolyticum]GLJ94555.1 transglutaminase [Microbacterium dextranolyticum]